MALKEQDIVFTTTDEAGNPVIQFPITRVENVEDAVRTVNKKKPDSNGDIQIDVDMSHLATKDELTKGLANKRDHTIQIANADLNTLLEDKTWACSGTLKNTPIPCTFCIVQAYDTGAPVSGNIVQVCYIPNQTNNTVRAFWRNCLNGETFGAWSESGAVKTVNSIAPDDEGNVNMMLAVYPVGSIYMSTNPANPGSLFGGTWKALDEGRVLIGAGAAYPAGQTGGKETHTLTTDEMPSHTHSGSTSSAGSHRHDIFANDNRFGTNYPLRNYSYAAVKGNADGPTGDSNYNIAGTSSSPSLGETSSSGNHSHTLSLQSAGGGKAHNNMQPYLSVYMWTRIK